MVLKYTFVIVILLSLFPAQSFSKETVGAKKWKYLIVKFEAPNVTKEHPPKTTMTIIDGVVTVISEKPNKQLQEFGEMGWELIDVEGNTYYFKKSIQ